MPAHLLHQCACLRRKVFFPRSTMQLVCAATPQTVACIWWDVSAWATAFASVGILSTCYDTLTLYFLSTGCWVAKLGLIESSDNSPQSFGSFFPCFCSLTGLPLLQAAGNMFEQRSCFLPLSFPRFFFCFFSPTSFSCRQVTNPKTPATQSTNTA